MLYLHNQCLHLILIHFWCIHYLHFIFIIYFNFGGFGPPVVYQCVGQKHHTDGPEHIFLDLLFLFNWKMQLFAFKISQFFKKFLSFTNLLTRGKRNFIQTMPSQYKTHQTILVLWFAIINPQFTDWVPCIPLPLNSGLVLYIALCF